ncbi:MAG TPA: sugar phosphate isomerase/epimerase family protein [Paracoccaceae bacterium]|nr:sugar phosphate isomerase/epimerase family protein [Paracoccaceae bacterium]
MTEATLPPVIGAAMPISALPAYREWLIEGSRDLEIQDFFSAEVLNGDWRGLVAEAKRQLRGHRGLLGIHGPFWGFSLATNDPDVRQVVVRRMDQGLDACAALEATQMVVHSPYTTWDYYNLDNYPDGRQRLIELVHASLGAAVRRAERLGVTLVLENIEDKDPHARVELARSFNSAHVRVSLDTGHAYYAHGATGAPAVDYYVVAAGDMLEHVHIQDADGYADRHWVPGEGTMRWHALFSALGRLSSRPRLILEIRDKGRILDGARFLAGLGLVR